MRRLHPERLGLGADHFGVSFKGRRFGFGKELMEDGAGVGLNDEESLKAHQL